MFFFYLIRVEFPCFYYFLRGIFVLISFLHHILVFFVLFATNSFVFMFCTSNYYVTSLSI